MDYRRNNIGAEEPNRGSSAVGIIFFLVALTAILTWAVSVFFGIAFTKALASVILVLFVVFIVLIMAGIS